jgi:hypothetical protein
MSEKYSHSEAFAVLKNTNEKISTNLTSYQYLTVLDNLLYESLAPIVTNTKFFDVFLSQVIGWQTLNPKRKTCGVGRVGLVSLSTLFFLTMDPHQKMKLIKRMKLHRNILFECITRWLDLMVKYPGLSEQVGTADVVSLLHDLHEQALMRTGYSLHSTFHTVTFWYKKAKMFKEQIMEKYTRMVISAAQRDYVELGMIEPLNDMVQSYMMTMSKGIDKCDADRGVLTSYIKAWLKSAKNNVEKRASYDSGEIHKQTGGQKAEHIELEEVEDTVSDDDLREREDNIKRVRTLAKLFDPKGYGRIALGIQEQLSQDDRDTLRALSLQKETV